MGTRGGNGDGRPADNGGQPEGLPDLPPEWGTIVIPDDPADLAEQAHEVRRELRREIRKARWRRRFGLTLGPNGETQPSLGLPLLIMSIAILATLTSLFVVAWPGTRPRVDPGPSASTAGRQVPDLVMLDGAGAPVRVRELVPAAILLIDGCTCHELVTETVRSAAPGVSVLAVDRTVPSFAPTASTAAIPLADREGALRSTLQLGPPTGAAAVVLVRRDGIIAYAVPAARSLDDFRGPLAQLS
jgi:hypothetical protein